MIYTKEVLSPEFTKHHIGFPGLPLVIHHFTAPDTGGPHDHPANFRTTVLKGSYVERIYVKTQQGNWHYMDFLRETGSSRVVEAATIHEIIALPEGECYTATIPEERTRKWGFWPADESGNRHFVEGPNQ